MGSYSYLTLGLLEVDWGKNDSTRDHSPLFRKSDRTIVPYYYADNKTIGKEALSTSLRALLTRLELIGYTFEGSKTEYNRLVAEYPYGNQELTFEEFQTILAKIDVDDRELAPSDEDHPDFYDFGEFARKFLFSKGDLAKFSKISAASWELGHFLDNIDPYVILRLLAENPANLDKQVCWRYQDLVEGGWETDEGVLQELDDLQKRLIITEGSSDTNILRAALEWLRPDIYDFFDFIDMEKNYPFTGSGSLVNFFKGLVKIGPIRETLFIFDNDSEGRRAFNACGSAGGKIRKTVLPSSDAFCHIHTLGPSGESIDNINEKAVSIEMFLDLEYKRKSPPVVRWTSFVDKSNTYQGELLDKDHYTKLFFEAAKKRDTTYDTRKLIELIDHVIVVLLRKTTVQH